MKVFIVDVRRFAPDESTVSSFRLGKAHRLHREEDRLLSLAASKALDHALSEHGLRERDMRYSEGEKGQPAFADCPLCFSISHSGSYACAAVSESPLGIDVQMTGRADMRIAERCFDARECDIIRASEDPDAAFTRIWTMRESAVKLTGEGLSGMRRTDMNAYHFTVFEPEGALLSVCTLHETPAELIFLPPSADET